MAVLDVPVPSMPDPPMAVQTALDQASVRLTLTPAGAAIRADLLLDTPATLNSQTPATWAALSAAGQWLDGVAGVVVLAGSGRSFSAGLDRRAFTAEGVDGQPGLVQLAGLDDVALDATIARYQSAFTVWGSSNFVSVAAVQGHAIGAGFQLALACDLRIAASDVQLAMREPSLGLVPDLGGTRPLVAAVGYPRALEICSTGRAVAAQEALATGLVQAVVDPDDLAAEVDRLVQALTAGDVGAVSATAGLLRGALERNPAEQLAAERAAQTRRLRVLATRWGMPIAEG